jgi:hypothetical protein
MRRLFEAIEQRFPPPPTIQAGAAVRAIDQPIDTGAAAGKWFLDMPGAFAEFETQSVWDR